MIVVAGPLGTGGAASVGVAVGGERGQRWESGEIVWEVDTMQEVEAVFGGKRLILRSQLAGQAEEVCVAAGVQYRQRYEKRHEGDREDVENVVPKTFCTHATR